MRGRWLKISLSRRLMADALYFAKGVPTVAARRTMALEPLVQARKAATTRVPWAAIMIKAYAIVADEFPELRQVYLKYPVPHFYEYPQSVASVTVERVHDGERMILACRIRNPSALPLAEIGRRIRHATKAPLNEIGDFTMPLRVARLPLPIRRMLWWLMLNIGRKRPNYLGTFGMSALPSPGLEALYALTTWTSGFSYGALNEDGSMIVTLIWDHRVFDGAQTARLLARMEKVLTGPIIDELRA